MEWVVGVGISTLKKPHTLVPVNTPPLTTEECYPHDTIQDLAPSTPSNHRILGEGEGQERGYAATPKGMGGVCIWPPMEAGSMRPSGQ